MDPLKTTTLSVCKHKNSLSNRQSHIIAYMERIQEENSNGHGKKNKKSINLMNKANACAYGFYNA